MPWAWQWNCNKLIITSLKNDQSTPLRHDQQGKATLRWGTNKRNKNILILTIIQTISVNA